MPIYAGMFRWTLPLLLLATPARAIEAQYEAYAAGLSVIDVTARYDIGAERYRVAIDYRTTGGLNLVMGSRQASSTDGRFVAGRAVPERFLSTGTYRGAPRLTQIDYPGGQPAVRQLVPPPEQEREPVPTDRQAGTIDTLSAMATVIAQINATGRCDGAVTVYDGHRLASLTAHTNGPQELDKTGRSSYAGPTLRCGFEGRQLAGFMLDANREQLERVQKGSAWFAAVTPGGPMIPVRIAFQTRWFGDITMYLVGAK